MIYLENFNEFKTEVIEMSNEYGSAFGVIHRVELTLNNWFSENKIDKSKLNLSDLEYPICVLKNINVEHNYRNKGYGNSLMSEFIDECALYNVKCIILESDSSEEQRVGFNLDEWYINWDFEEIGESHNNKIFIKFL